MKDTDGPHLDVELLAPAVAGPLSDDRYCVARVCALEATDARFRVGDVVLTPAPVGGPGGRLVPAASCVALPAQLPIERALAVVPLAMSLWVWDCAGLEPGEVAVYTACAGLDKPLATVAMWRSARDVFRLDGGEGTSFAPSGVISVSAAQPEATGNLLATAMRAAPGAVAAIMSAKSDVLDLVLEASPMWGRVVLAAVDSGPATIDFYNNVHRKGCRMLSVPVSPLEMFNTPWIDIAGMHIDRAARILLNEKLASACLP